MMLCGMFGWNRLSFSKKSRKCINFTGESTDGKTDRQTDTGQKQTTHKGFIRAERKENENFVK